MATGIATTTDVIYQTSIKLWDGEEYEKVSIPQQAMAKVVLSNFEKRCANELPKNAIIADIGCGNGLVTSWITDHFPQSTVIGIDPSSEMIQHAQANHTTPSRTFFLDEAEKLETIKDEEVDAVFSSSAFHWVKNHPIAFQQIHRALKPGGWIALFFAIDTGAKDPILSACAQAMKEEPFHTYLKDVKQQVQWNLSNMTKLEKELSEAKFKVESLEILHFENNLGSKENFTRWLRASFQQLNAITDLTDREKCLNRTVELYLNNTSHLQPKVGCSIFIDTMVQIIAKKI